MSEWTVQIGASFLALGAVLLLTVLLLGTPG